MVGGGGGFLWALYVEWSAQVSPSTPTSSHPPSFIIRSFFVYFFFLDVILFFGENVPPLLLDSHLGENNGLISCNLLGYTHHPTQEAAGYYTYRIMDGTISSWVL